MLKNNLMIFAMGFVLSGCSIGVTTGKTLEDSYDLHGGRTVKLLEQDMQDRIAADRIEDMVVKESKNQSF